MRDNLRFQTITQTTERSLMSEELLSFFPIKRFKDRIFDESEKPKERCLNQGSLRKLSLLSLEMFLGYQIDLSYR